MVGGSTMFGSGESSGQTTIPAILPTIQKIEVINVGVSLNWILFVIFCNFNGMISRFGIDASINIAITQQELVIHRGRPSWTLLLLNQHMITSIVIITRQLQCS